MLHDKVAIVTGGGRGIGRAVCHRLAQQGAKVVVCDKGTAVHSAEIEDPSVAASVAAELSDSGAEAMPCAVDVTDRQAVEAMFEAAISAWGRVDIVVNAAGIIRDRMLWNVPSEEWDDVIRVHLKSCYTTVGCLARHVRARGGEPADAAVVTFSSSAGVFGNVGSTAYGTAKAGVLGFTRLAALELRRLAIRVNCVVPFAWTRMAEILPQEGPEAEERIARLKQLQPEHVANLVVWLVATADPALTGQVLGMRGKELLVFAQPSIEMRMTLRDTSPEELTRLLGDRPSRRFPPLRASGEIFDYDPVV